MRRKLSWATKVETKKKKKSACNRGHHREGGQTQFIGREVLQALTGPAAGANQTRPVQSMSTARANCSAGSLDPVCWVRLPAYYLGIHYI